MATEVRKNDMPVLSICIVTYNQEDYIAQAIDSVLMQKTQYKFEILIGEDASTDGTRNILKAYENKYPTFFKIIYSDVNTYNTKNNMFVKLRKMAMGKYIIILEGDDFWIDNCKIEKQVSFLEKNTSYIGVAHNCLCVNENSDDVLSYHYPECKDENYTFSHWLSGIFPGQTATMMYINPKYHSEIDWSLLEAGIIPGDRMLYYTLAINGKVFCIQEKMTAYRFVQHGGISYCANYIYDFKKAEMQNFVLLQYVYSHGSYKQMTATELIYFKNLVQGYRSGQISLSQMLFHKYKLSTRLQIYGKYVLQFAKHYILHKKLYME